MTIETGGGSYAKIAGGPLTNQGTIRVADGDQMALDVSQFVNQGTVEVVGRLTLGRNGNYAAGNHWRNEGEIRLKPGSYLILGSEFTADDIGTIIDEGADNIYLAGILDNTGRTLDLESLPIKSPLTFYNGTLRGGTVTSSGDATFDIINSTNAATFDAVTLDMDLDIPGGPGTGVWFYNDLTILNNHTITVPAGARLQCRSSDGPQLLGGQGVIMASYRSDTSWDSKIGGSELMIGEGITILNDEHPFRKIYVTFKENRGKIVSKTTGTYISATGDTLTDTSMLQAIDGGELVVRSNGTFTAKGTMWAADGGLLSVRPGQWSNEGRLHLDGGKIEITADTFSNAPGGIIDGSGEVELTEATLLNEGTVAPGNSPGALLINGDYRQSPLGMLSIEIAGTTSGDLDLLNVGGTATLDGFLDLELLGGFRPDPNDTFVVLTASMLNGNFANAADEIHFAGGSFDVSYAGNQVTLTNYVPEPSTFALLCIGALGFLTHGRRHNT